MLLSERLVRRVAFHLREKMAEFPESELERIQNERTEGDLSPDGWIRAIIDRGEDLHLAIVVHGYSNDELLAYFYETDSPIILFRYLPNGEIVPVILKKKGSKTVVEEYFDETSGAWKEREVKDLNVYIRFEDPVDVSLNDKIIALTAFPMPYALKEYEEKKALTPFQRLLLLLKSERHILLYIYVYAIISGLIALSLPLGVQATFRLISSGKILTSVIVVIALVIVGLGASGGLQLMQLWLVEILQQRVFAKAAFEFAYRIPKILPSVLKKYYPPELMNRFFDVVILQKELPKLLVDLSAAALQVVFGLLLLSLYHPFFLGLIFFTFLFIGILLYYTFDRGLYTSIKESTYKYKIAHWLEEIARTVRSFRLSTSSRLPLSKMDELVNYYLYYRKEHFKVLVNQYLFVLVFKIIIVGGLLILGSTLVVERQISLGQLVASEVMIILVVNAIEKLVLGLPTVYDALTAVEKIAQVTDLPLEKRHGVLVDFHRYPEGLEIQMEDVRASYNSSKRILKGITLTALPGEAICIAGPEGAGKHTLMRVLTGFVEYEGYISVNGFSLKDIDVDMWRAVVENNFSEDEVFAGTILENIVMGKPNVKMKDVYEAIEVMGLADVIGRLPKGIHTELLADGRPLSISERHKLILARCIVSKPKLLIIIDHFQEMQNSEKKRILQWLTQERHPWTLLMLSNDPIFLSLAKRVIVLEKGQVVAEGTYEELMNERHFRAFMTENV
ncbi:peptidase domain-containing ABC transporter [Thermonema rossianum]|uniref:peptidase domain-containing ABC transporter n=1 Tax=Thermonema rossianum TaxID=55505 RepID=UPI0006891FDA|nr:ABC transporter ATP-binding protein [Thermonema rossianum]